jgi:CBS domain-containing protein
MTTRLPVAESSAWTGVSVSEAMRPGVVTCPRDAPLPTIAAIMTTHLVHAVLVAPLERGVPLVVTDRALVEAGLQGAAGSSAADLAREPMGMLSTQATLAEAVELMAVGYATHVLAIDPSSGHPAGMVSSLDIAAAAGGVPFRRAPMPLPGPISPLPDAKELSQMRVGDVMHPGVTTATPDAPLRTVARIMAEQGVHCVAIAGICSAGGRDPHFTWGLIADIDLVRALHRGPATLAAGTIAATEPIALPEDASLDRAATLMVKHDTSHLVAVSPAGLPTGMVSTLDIARIMAAGS